MHFNKTILAFCGALIVGSAGAASSQESPNKIEKGMQGGKWPGVYKASWSLPTTVPTGLVPMIVYVPEQQMHGQPVAAPVAPHTHAPTPPKSAQKISATHCSINDVAVLTKDAPSCQKAGGEIVSERASFGLCKFNNFPPYNCIPI